MPRAALDDSQAESRDLFETLSSTQDELRRAIRDGAEAQSLLRVERDQLQQWQLQLRDAASRAQREVDDWRYLFLKECEVTTEGTPNCSKDAVTSCGTGRVTKGWTSNAASASHDSHEQLPRSDLPPRYKPNAEQKQVISAQGGANGYALSAPVLDDDTPRPQQQQREVPVSSPLVGIAQEFVGALTQALQGSGAPNHAAQFTQLAARQSTVNTELPAFSGKPAEWPAFVSIYRSTTEQCGFTDAENAQRLTKSLSGAAKDAVRLMLAVPGNVGEAIAALERRFGRPEQVISDLIGKAKGARPLRADDAESLIAFTTSVTNIVMTMKLLDSRGHMTNPSLRAELVDKLPAGLRTQWGEHLMARGLQSDSLSLEVFASWLSERADAAALVTTTTRSATITSKSHPSTLLATSHGASQSGFRKQQRSGPQCQKCNGSHPVTSCAEFKALTIKRRWDMAYATGLCAVCLKAGHWKATCKATSCRKCSGKHHELLHTDRTDHQSQQAHPGTTSGNKPKETSLVLKANNGAAHTAQVVRSSTVLFMTLPVVLEYAGRQTTARALLDSGSSLSFVRQDVAAELEMKGTEDEGFAVSVLGGKTLQGPQQQVHATLRSTDGAFQCELHPWTQEDITAPLPAMDYDELQQQYPHLQDIPLETQNSERIDVLLGLDAIAAHQVLQEVVGQPGEPIGRRLPLGWVCLGPTGHPPEQRVEVTAHATPAERLDNLVERFWETEQIGLVPSQTVADQEAELLVDKTMKLQDGRVWTRLPWASGSEPDLPDNREMAEKRLYSLERTLSKRPEVRRQYAEVIDSYHTKGYIKRRGCPSVMVSDNGTNFTSAERELREAATQLDKAKIHREGVQQGLQWKFNPPRSPHHGGVFEAMIRCAKRALTSVMGRADLHDEELLTAFVEAEGMLNSRPLAALSDDPQDEAVLTPNHFLVGRMDPPFAIEVLASQSTAVSPRQRWKVVQQQVNCIWRRWQKELVALLNSRKKWLKLQKNLKEDDLVLVIEDNIPRNAWSLGRVIETHPGADGLVRVVNVKVGSKVRRRAVQRLVPLSSRKSED